MVEVYFCPSFFPRALSPFAMLGCDPPPFHLQIPSTCDTPGIWLRLGARAGAAAGLCSCPRLMGKWGPPDPWGMQGYWGPQSLPASHFSPWQAQSGDFCLGNVSGELKRVGTEKHFWGLKRMVKSICGQNEVQGKSGMGRSAGTQRGVSVVMGCPHTRGLNSGAVTGWESSTLNP